MDLALRKMSRRIQEAAQGTGAASVALQRLGLDAQELAKLTPDEQFLALADAMKSTRSHAERLQHTMALFESEGMPLVNTLSKESKRCGV